MRGDRVGYLRPADRAVDMRRVVNGLGVGQDIHQRDEVGVRRNVGARDRGGNRAREDVDVVRVWIEGEMPVVVIRRRNRSLAAIGEALGQPGPLRRCRGRNLRVGVDQRDVRDAAPRDDHPGRPGRLLPRPLVLREAVDGLQRVLNGVIGRGKVLAEVGRVDRNFCSRLVVGTAAATTARWRLKGRAAGPVSGQHVAVIGGPAVDVGGVHIAVAHEVPVVEDQFIENLNVAAYLRVVGVSALANARIDVLIDHTVFQVKIYACIVVTLTRRVARLCPVDGCNCAVTIVSETAYQDTQANTSVDDYTNISVRIMEVESSCSYP